MLDIDPIKLRPEIKAALELRRKTTRKSRSLIQQYAAEEDGNTFAGGLGGYANHCFEWVVNIVPSLVMHNPGVKVTDNGMEDDATQTIGVGMKSLLPQIDVARQLQLIAYDVQFDFGVGLVSLEDCPGLKIPGRPGAYMPQRPAVRRLSPRLYFEDARGPEFGAPRFQGHIVIKDRNDMLAALLPDGRKKYDQAAVEAIGQESGLREMQEDLMQEGIFISSENRDQIVFFELYCPERKCWVSLGFDESGARFLCTQQEREYKGPVTGPYQMFGTYVIPDQVYPLANLAVTRKDVEEINMHRGQLARDASTSKRILVVSGGSTGVICAIQDAVSGAVLSIPGFNGLAQEIVMGGPLKEQAEHVDRLETKLDRKSGLSTIARGEIDPDATATGIAQAGAFTDVRLKFAQNNFKRDTKSVLAKVADLMDNCDDVAFPVTVTQKDPMSGKEVRKRGTFFGGKALDQLLVNKESTDQYPWKRSLTIEIEPYTMEHTNQTVLRASMLEAQKYAVEVADHMLVNPAIQGQAMIDDLFETLNIPKASRRYIDFDMLRAMMALGAATAAGQPGAMAGAMPVTPGQPGSPPVSGAGRPPGRGAGAAPPGRSPGSVGFKQKPVAAGAA